MRTTHTLSPPLEDGDIASLERATLDAVCPAEVHEIPGWLLPYDPLPIGRAQSAVPLAHTPLSVPVLREIVELMISKKYIIVFFF